jgi:lipid II:glycine glycyltransferase (peptidoglycan interpeptide bridge formation enzyme)
VATRFEGDLGGGARLVEATDMPAVEWDRLAVLSDGGHAFQSHAWGELKAGAGWSVRRFRVERDEAPVAVFAVQVRSMGAPVTRRLGALGRLVPAAMRDLSYVYAPRGPVVLDSRTGSDTTLALAAVRHAAAGLAAGIVTVDPLWRGHGRERQAFRDGGFVPARRDIQISRTAMRVPLVSDEGEQHQRVRKSTANLINRARREGVVVERIDLAGATGDGDGPSGDPRTAALSEMHDLLSATARREGLILRDRDYQLAQWRELGAAGHATIWFAGVDGKRWVGSVTLRCGATLHQYQAGSADGADLRNVPANHLLQWEILRWAAGVGYRYYDLGGVDTPSARGLPADARHPLWNLYLFKRGFGAEGVEYVPAHEWAVNALVRLAWGLARGARG